MGRYRKLRLSRNSSITSTYSGRLGSNGEEDKPDYEELNGVKSALTANMAVIDGSSAKLLQTLQLSNSDINSVAFGKSFMLATGSSDKKIVVCQWTPGTGYTPMLFSPLTEHKYSVSCVDFSPYGSILASASVDGFAMLWDVTNGEKLACFIAPGNSPLRVCQFSSRSTLLLTAGDSGAVNIWDISKQTLLSTLTGHEETIHAASFTPLDSYLVSGCSGGLLNLWDINGSEGQNKPLAIYENAHDLGITTISFAPAVVTSDGGLGKQCLMVTGGHDHLIKLWNVSIGLEFAIRPLRVFQGHSESIYCVRVSNSGGLIVSASGDKTVRLWELSGKCSRVLEGHDRFVTSIGLSHDGKLLASGSNDKQVKIWDLSGSMDLTSELKSQGAAGEFNLTAGDIWPHYEKLCRSKMLQDENGVVLKATFSVPKVDFNSCLIVGSSIVVAAASSSKCVYAWDIESGKELDIVTAVTHKYSVNSISYCPQTNLIASASTDGTINLFNTKEKVAGLYHPSGGALRVCRFSPDGTFLIAAGDDEKASLWHMNTLTVAKQFEEHRAAIYGCAFSPDGKFVVSGCVNGYLKLWDCMDESSNASIVSQNAHELGVTSVDFSPKGLGGSFGKRKYLLASGGNDSEIKLWYIVAGSSHAKFILWQTFTDHGTASVMCVSFAPSGKLLASAAGDKTVRLWDVVEGACVHVVEAHNRYVTGVAFAGAGSLLVSCSSDHTTKVWQLQGSLACETALVENKAVENSISKWTCEEVEKWLSEIGHGDLATLFRDNEVNGEKLAVLNNKFLQEELKIEDDAVRKQLITELQWLKSLGIGSSKQSEAEGSFSAPQEFFCPITHEIMVEPVSTCDGCTYERAAISEWLLTGKTTSPLTNMVLENMSLTPNFDLQNRISEFLAQRLNS